MSLTLETLRHILILERKQGFRNGAVIGGLEKLAARWQESETPPHLRGLLKRLQSYPHLTREERPPAVEEMLDILARRKTENPPPSITSEEKPSITLVETTDLDSPVTEVKGIGPKRAEQLSRLDVETIRDLLYLFPHRYNDFQQMKPIYKLRYGEVVTIAGTIQKTKSRRGRGGQDIVTTVISDGTGTIQATWFNQPYLTKTLRAGRQVVISGEVDEYLGRLVFTSPEWEILAPKLVHTNGIIPVYPLTEGISARWMRRQMKRTVDYWTLRLPDHLPSDVRERRSLLPLDEAIRQIHFPEGQEDLARARRRLSFDDLLLLQLRVLHQRHQWRSRPGRPLPLDQNALQGFLEHLPFTLTGAQHRALQEILEDIQQPEPMNRLLQGDVGSGKTVVALAVMLQVVAAGCQAVLMAPTELLAEQHAHTISRLLDNMKDERRPSRVLLTGSLSKGVRKAAYEAIREGVAEIVIGTHALIQEGVTFHDLALAVIDEQHRFGVAQRASLRQKGHNPHVLVMSATPIPRTLALTLYGDLDISTIDEMPPGRKPVTTRWLAPRERERAYHFLRSQVEESHQAFIICPLVEESEKVEARAAVEEHQRLSDDVFPGLRVGLLHGRMSGQEKDKVMRRFAAGELDILVSTPVVEVGIDIPNATVMLIEGADRFGLAQLHQFRGRVGRGEAPSYCLLLAESPTSEAEERLRAVEGTQDGFALAEKDLEMRGPGEFFGLRQSGLLDLPSIRRAGGLAKLSDVELLKMARQEARRIFQADPDLSQPRHQLLHRWVLRLGWQGEGDLS
ncbi:MAG: ATP-dependent DNA helicase RecG [Chloroflexota bacterium]|nr:ATP-dependent DNA helicase RecG [Chloroflexota bacterium]